MTEPKSPSPAGLRAIPSINTLLDHPAAQALAGRYSRARVARCLRVVAAKYREAQLSHGGSRKDVPLVTDDLIVAETAGRLLSEELAELRRVVNATGIVIHTNLGRAPMAAQALEAAARAGAGYTNLEFDLESGKRGKRADGAETALCRLTGAEAAAIVNNHAAAVLLALAAVAGDAGEVIVSRGELVEIGGSFRIPDVLRQSGAALVEVGATNRTHLRDYQRAITPNTRAILRVHASNYKIVGFTNQVGASDLSRLARERGIALLEDLGSGALIDLAQYGLPSEPTPQAALKAGVDIVTFSGDKLLGGPQAGLIVGRRDLIERMTAHPLYRALRADKMCLAALGATLDLYERYADDLPSRIPILGMLAADDASLLRRARKLARALTRLPGVTATVARGESYAGGGSLPETALPSRVVNVRIDGMSAQAISEKLRRTAVPIIGVIVDNTYHLDVRTVRDDELTLVRKAFVEILTDSSVQPTPEL